MGNIGGDEDIRLAKLSELGDSLIKLNRAIRWECLDFFLKACVEKRTREKDNALRLTVFLCLRCKHCNGSVHSVRVRFI